MSSNWKISNRQFSILVTLNAIGTAILITLAGLASEVKQDAWISVIAGVGISLALIGLYNVIGDLYPNMSFVKAIEAALGKWLGTVVSLLFIFFSFNGAVSLVWIVGNFITTQMMPETPMLYINILFTAVIIFGVRLGLETVARSAEILFPWVIVFFLFLILFSTPNLKAENIQPVFENGIKPVLRGALSFISFFSLPSVVLLMIFPASLNKPKEGKKAFFTGVLVAGIIMAITAIFSILILGSDFTARNMYPTYVLAKKISIGKIIDRVEAVIAGLWLITIFFKAVLYLYATVLGIAQTLNLRDYRPLTLPFGMLMVALSLRIYPNIPYFIVWNEKTFPPFAIVSGFFLPLLILIVGKIRSKKERKIADNERNKA
ncbi:GerAB/ArcD/ProY family transporter [Petroclostridium xylanilyticum]|jgi:spore germination protein KB|uniref:GerAB/ArcD/ProY family transporter n=1 Tax=Petroclostridium xylanilyticum TaxID=1792311 RepID=UPI000B98591B|nr:endospore germination permease [Petroclostridium xylanilyticum]